MKNDRAILGGDHPVDNSRIKSTPLIERLGGDFLNIMMDCQEAYTRKFKGAEEIGSSDVSIFLIEHLSDHGIDHNTVSKEDWIKMKKWGCSYHEEMA